MQTPKFRVVFMEEASGFLESLEEKAGEKIIYNITKATYSNDKELFKKLSGEIWEFRTRFSKMQYRMFAFWDKTDKVDTVVIVTHGIIKKTNKIRRDDVDKAERLRAKYFELKEEK